jgi:hypothetical protein
VSARDARCITSQWARQRVSGRNRYAAGVQVECAALLMSSILRWPMCSMHQLGTGTVKDVIEDVG